MDSRQDERLAERDEALSPENAEWGFVVHKINKCRGQRPTQRETPVCDPVWCDIAIAKAIRWAAGLFLTFQADFVVQVSCGRDHLVEPSFTVEMCRRCPICSHGERRPRPSIAPPPSHPLIPAET